MASRKDSEVWHAVRSVVVLVAMGDLIGQLSVDLIFDNFTDVNVFKSYYCTLLVSLNKWPQILRVAAPCGLLALSGGTNALSSARTKVDLFSAGLLMSVGAVAFAKSVHVVDELCSAQGAVETLQASLLRWHLLIAAVFFFAFSSQLLSLIAVLLAKADPNNNKKEKDYSTKATTVKK